MRNCIMEICSRFTGMERKDGAFLPYSRTIR